MDLMTRHSLDAGFSVVVEGILHPDRYAEMLLQLVRDHRGSTRAYFWDLPFEETLRRHETKDKASEFGEAEMREWWYGAARIGRAGRGAARPRVLPGRHRPSHRDRLRLVLTTSACPSAWKIRRPTAVGCSSLS